MLLQASSLVARVGRSALASSPVLAPVRGLTAASVLHHGDHEPAHTEYHRHSTRYRVTPRDKLKLLEDIKFPHYEPVTLTDKATLKIVKWLRKLSDSYFKDNLIERAVMLETIAAVPGMVAGMAHHARALRQMRHCNWIKPTMDEAENERMHLMTFMEIMKPSWSQRVLIVSGQGVFMTAYTFFYLLMPKACHRFVGYLEEEACHTYSLMLQRIDAGQIKNVESPNIAKSYWGLPADATLRDVVLVVRADEADHRLVNHHIGDLFNDKSLGKPCEAFDIDLDRPMQMNEEQEKAAGMKHADYVQTRTKGHAA